MFPTQAALKVHARRAHNHVDQTAPVFNKALHSVQGLPTCRFCKHRFSRWQTLASHITSNSCPSFDHNAMEKLEPEIAHQNEPPQHGDKPGSDILVINQLQEVHAAASKGLNAFIPLKSVTSKLMQTCALCGQWVASHRCMKRHYQYSHQNLLEGLGKRVQQLINRSATACPTCHFCHVRCKDWREHVRKCTVTWQCAIMTILQQDGQRRAGRILRDSSELPPAGASGLEQAKTSTCTRVAGRPSGDALRTPAVAASKLKLTAYFGKACGETGGRDQSAETGSFPRLLHEAGRAQHPAPPLPNREGVSGSAAGEPGLDPRLHSAENSDGYCYVQGTRQPPREGYVKRML